jgi:signal transduction histidine kinase
MMAIGLISIFNMKNMYENVSLIYNNKLQTIVFASDVRKNVLNIRYYITLSSYVKYNTDMEKNIFETDKELKTLLLNVEQIEMDKTEKTLFNKFEVSYREYLDSWEKTKVYLKLNYDPGEEHKAMFKQQEMQVLKLLDDFVKHSIDQASDLKEGSLKIYQANTPILILCIIIFVAFLIIFSSYLIDLIRNSIKEVFLVLSKLTGINSNNSNNKNEFEKMKNALSLTIFKQEDIEQLTAMNQELIAINDYLKEHAETIEELAIVKERNRFSNDIHDNLGHTMILLITLLEVCYENFDTHDSDIKEKIHKAIDISKGGLKDLRSSVEGLSSYMVKTDDLISSLKSLFNDFFSSGIKIDFSYDDYMLTRNPAVSNTIYRICREALTNSLKHGKAKQITIVLQSFNNVIKLYIFDDGLGCKKIVKGNGLSGIEKRVKEVNGNIIIGSDGESGFNINVEIPLED